MYRQANAGFIGSNCYAAKSRIYVLANVAALDVFLLESLDIILHQFTDVTLSASLSHGPTRLFQRGA